MNSIHKYAKFLILMFSVFLVPAYSEGTEGHVLGGKPGAPMKIEVFSDFQCPHCREFYLTVMRRVLKDYAGTGKVCVVYHAFPLPAYKYSRLAACYGEAASRMGPETLLKVYEVLYREQDTWIQNGQLDPVVSKVLSQEEFQKLKKIMQDPSVSAEVEKEFRFGSKIGITGTPTLILSYNGKQQRVEMHQPLIYDTLKRFIDLVVK